MFQWSKVDSDRPERIGQIKGQLADVLIYAIVMDDNYNIDFDEIIDAKRTKNLNKYPRDKNINLQTK